MPQLTIRHPTYNSGHHTSGKLLGYGMYACYHCGKINPVEVRICPACEYDRSILIKQKK